MITVVVGNAQETRFLDQCQVGYDQVLVNPKEDTISKLTRTRRYARDKCLIIIFFHSWSFYSDSMRNLVFNSQHYRLDLIIFDKDAACLWPPHFRVQFDIVILFQGALGDYPRRFDLHPQPVELPKFQRFDVGKPSTYSRREVLNAWPKHWTKENHLDWPRTIQQRVKLLLLAQLDQQSLFGKLDKHCLLNILLQDAALD
jgi:hypothetical protein